MHRTKKQNATRRWFQKAASEMEIELDEDELYPLCWFCSTPQFNVNLLVFV